jgi:hypothetical protein
MKRKILIIIDMQEEFVEDHQLIEQQRYICKLINSGQYKHIVNVIYGYSDILERIYKSLSKYKRKCNRYDDNGNFWGKFALILKKSNNGSKNIDEYFKKEVNLDQKDIELHLVGVNSDVCVLDTFKGLLKRKYSAFVHKKGTNWCGGLEKYYPKNKVI